MSEQTYGATSGSASSSGGSSHASMGEIISAVAILGGCCAIAPQMQSAVTSAMQAIAAVESIRGASEAFAPPADHVDTIRQAVDAAAKATQGHWHGQDQAAFLDAVARYDQQLAALTQRLKSVGDLLAQAESAYGQVYEALLITAIVTLAILIVMQVLRNIPYTAAFANAAIQMIGMIVPMIVRTMVQGAHSTLDQIGSSMRNTASAAGTKAAPSGSTASSTTSGTTGAGPEPVTSGHSGGGTGASSTRGHTTGGYASGGHASGGHTSGSDDQSSDKSKQDSSSDGTTAGSKSSSDSSKDPYEKVDSPADDDKSPAGDKVSPDGATAGADKTADPYEKVDDGPLDPYPNDSGTDSKSESGSDTSKDTGSTTGSSDDLLDPYPSDSGVGSDTSTEASIDTSADAGADTATDTGALDAGTPTPDIGGDGPDFENAGTAFA